MASFNKVILIGNLTADPELKQTQGGTKVCSFSIAVNRRGKDAGCDFINVVAWKERAEFVTQWFKKGKPILVCGQLQTRSWTDKQGNKRIATEVVADEVSFVGNNESATETKSAPSTYVPNAYTTPNSQNFESVTDDGTLPF